MSIPSDRERELRALDALIVSQLRGRCDDEVDVEHLPALTQEEQDALDSLGADFVENLLAGDVGSPNAATIADDTELAMAGEGTYGMNRADVIDDDTAEELNRKRQEIIDRSKSAKEESDGADE